MRLGEAISHAAARAGRRRPQPDRPAPKLSVGLHAVDASDDLGKSHRSRRGRRGGSEAHGSWPAAGRLDGDRVASHQIVHSDFGMRMFVFEIFGGRRRRDPRRFETMPSQPSLRAYLKTMGPGSSNTALSTSSGQFIGSRAP